MTPVLTPVLDNRPAAEADVIACYRTILGRAPENRAVVREALQDRPDLWTLISRFLTCEEASRRQDHASARRCAHDQDSRRITVDAEPTQLAELVAHIEAVWSRYGRTDAYFSVLTHPAFRMERITGADIEAFYATGVQSVSQFERVCRRNGVDLAPSASVLDLGCGVGRLGEAFCDLCRTYVGVDVSREHLQIAEERFGRMGLTGVELYLLGDFLKSKIRYDVFYSVIVLQHNPPPIIHQLLDACLERLNPGGLAYFQVPCFLYDYSFSVADYLAGEGRKDEMEIHALPQHLVFDLLAKHGLTPIEVTPDPNIGPLGYSYAFFARKAAAATGPKGAPSC